MKRIVYCILFPAAAVFMLWFLFLVMFAADPDNSFKSMNEGIVVGASKSWMVAVGLFIPMVVVAYIIDLTSVDI